MKERWAREMGKSQEENFPGIVELLKEQATERLGKSTQETDIFLETRQLCNIS